MLWISNPQLRFQFHSTFALIIRSSFHFPHSYKTITTAEIVITAILTTIQISFTTVCLPLDTLQIQQTDLETHFSPFNKCLRTLTLHYIVRGNLHHLSPRFLPETKLPPIFLHLTLPLLYRNHHDQMYLMDPAPCVCHIDLCSSINIPSKVHLCPCRLKSSRYRMIRAIFNHYVLYFQQFLCIPQVHRSSRTFCNALGTFR